MCLEPVEPQEIPFKVCVNVLQCMPDQLYRDCGQKKGFLQSFNLPKCMVVSFLMVEELFSLLLY